MKRIVDTNVPIVANNRDTDASLQCVLNCIEFLEELRSDGKIVIDNNWHILREYMNNLEESGQPGLGDRFFKWVLTNMGNSDHCETVTITPTDDSGKHFDEYPEDEALQHFDLSDRKFVAVALTHPDNPPIVNAKDSDWWHHRVPMQQAGIQLIFICEDDIKKDKT